MKTDQEINEAIAEKCGKPIPFHRSSEKEVREVFDADWKLIPNYCSDLNAMHEAETFIQQFDNMMLYRDCLFMAVGLNPIYWAHQCPAPEFLKVATATARQRAEAFCRTAGISLE